MTAAVAPYSGGGAAGRLPAGLWAAGLGLSLLLHFLVLVYGLPDLTTSEAADEPEQRETEIILDTGGPAFGSVAAVNADELVETPAEIADIIGSEATSAVPDTLAEATAAAPVENIVEAPVKTLAETDAVAPLEQAPAPAAIETARPPEVDRVNAAEAVEPAQTAPIAGGGIVSAPLPSPPVAVAIPPVAVTEPGTMAESVETEETITALPEEPTVSVAPEIAVAQETVPVVSGKPVGNDQTVVAALSVEPVSNIPPPVIPAESVTTVAAIPADPAVTDPPASDLAAVNPVSIDPAPVISGVEAALPVPEAVRPTGAGVAVAPAEPSSVIQPGLANAESVAVEQEIAAINPIEGAGALAPADLETEPIPAAPGATVAPDNVAPAEVETLDPMERVASYVASYNAGDCAHLSVQSAGADTASITAFGASILPFVTFDQRFSNDQGFDANIEVRIVTQPQCQLLDTLGFSNGIEAAGLISLNSTLVRSGTSVSGVIRRDLPMDEIALAAQNGVVLSGMGPPEVYLIDDAGQIHDGRSYILPHSDPVRAGAWKFSIPVTKLSSGKEETALVLAVWNRPKDNQPKKFGRWPSSRISKVLEHPGVYSLVAFKVTR